MWIRPKQLHTLDFVPDTEALNLDSSESSQICAQSLFVRSKPSPARTWLLKWKRDSWSQHLFGRILNPSLGNHFVTAWTSLLVATHANHSAQQESDSAQKTQDIFGPTSQAEFAFSDPSSASSRTSKDISASDSEKSLENWNQWVTKCRGEYSLRVKSAHLTRGNECSSWPTIRASEYKDVGPVGSKSHDHMLGKGYLCAVVTQDAANWPTPAVMDTTGGSYKTEWKDGRAVSYHNHAQENPVAYGAKLSDAVKHGLPAPANPSTLGSRQGLWPTARSLDGSVNESLETWTARHHRKEAEGINLHRPLPIAVMQEQNKQLWPTITAHTPDMESNGPNGHSGTYLAGAVKAAEAWPTPTAISRVRDEETMQKCLKFRQSNGKTSVPLYLEEKVQQWATPQASDPEHSGPNQRSSSGRPALPAQAMQWATPRSGKTTDENPETWAKRQEKGDVATMPLTAQVKCWGTPTARDHKSGRGNEEREYKELTPMVERTQSGKLNPRWVETLMGLPVGWTMPSCKSPVTIELTNCASSATELSQPQQSEHSEF